MEPPVFCHIPCFEQNEKSPMTDGTLSFVHHGADFILFLGAGYAPLGRFRARYSSSFSFMSAGISFFTGQR